MTCMIDLITGHDIMHYEHFIEHTRTNQKSVSVIQLATFCTGGSHTNTVPKVNLISELVCGLVK